MFYWVIFIIFAVFSFIEQCTLIDRAIVRRWFYYAVFFLFCLSFLKWERGSDWDPYLTIFMDGSQYVGEENTEKGFMLFNKVIRHFTNSYTVYLFFQGCIYFTLYLILIRRINDILESFTIRSCYFPILLYDFSIGFAGIFASRSKLAYLICLFSVLYIYKGQLYRFLAAIFIASTIHATSLAFLFAYPLFRSGFDKRFFLLFTVACVAFFGIGAYLEPLFAALDYSRYAGYVKENDSMGIVNFIKWGVLLLIMMVFKYKNNNYLYYGVYKLYMGGLVLFVWCQLYAHLAQRIAALYMSAIIFWIAMLFYSHTLSKRILLLYGLIFYCGMALYGQLNSEYRSLYIPFKFFWETIPVEVY